MNEISQIGPQALLVAGLNILGWMFKQSPIKNWLIPIILPIAGGAAAPFVITGDGLTLAVKILYGFGLGWTAVGANQAWRQVTDGRRSDAEPPTPTMQQPTK